MVGVLSRALPTLFASAVLTLGAPVGLESEARAAASEATSYAVSVVRVTVREANGRVYRAATQAVRAGKSASFDIISDLHRHTLKLDTAAGERFSVTYSRDGSVVLNTRAGASTKRVFKDAGHTVEVKIVPTLVTVGRR